MEGQTAQAAPRGRVFIASFSPLMRALICNALDRAGFPVTETPSYSQALTEATAVSEPAVVIAPAASTGLTDDHAAALRARPRLRVLSVATGRTQADLFELSLVGPDVGCDSIADAVWEALANCGTDKEAVR